MHFIGKLKIGDKLAVGFGLVLLILITISAFGIYQLNNISEQFAKFSIASKQDALVGEIQGNFFSSRIAFIKMLEKNDSSQQQIMIERYGKMNSAINDFIKTANDPNIKQQIEGIKGSADNYRDGFVKIMEINKQLNQIYNWIVNLRGNDIEKALSGLLETAELSGDTKLIRSLNSAQLNFLRARMYEKEYYFYKNDSDYEKHISNYNEFEAALNNLKIENIDRYEENYKRVYEAKTMYKDNFSNIANKLRETKEIAIQMEKIGPEISDKIEAIKISLITKKDHIDNFIKRQSDISMISMVVLSIFAIVLGILIALRIYINIVGPVKSVTKAFKGISEGEADLGMRINVKTDDEVGQMAMYFNNFMVRLEEMITEITDSTWLKTGQTEFNELIRGENDLNTLCNKAISYLSKKLNAQLGIMYVKNKQGEYKKQGSYATEEVERVKEDLNIGQGLVGQAILDKEALRVTDVPESYFKISSGSGSNIPNQILIIPCVLKDEVTCVFEFATLSEFGELEKKFVNLVGETIAFAISNEEKQKEIKLLLDTTLHQTEELQAQQEELRQSNEELQEQTKALQESEMYLQSQSEELRVANEELEEKGKELEMQKKELIDKNETLNNSQIEIKKKAEELEQANRYKSEFLANMSHELRTPLNSILVLSQLLLTESEKYNLNEKQKEFAQTINLSGTELLTLINDILDISKVEVGKLDIIKEDVSVKKIGEYVERNFTQIASEKGISLEVKMEEDLYETIYTDVVRVKQIIKNLLSNAIKFTEKGSITVSIERFEKEEHESIKGKINKGIRFRVTDTGIGISREEQSIIFEAFRQADGTTNRKYGGTGLGLSISRELARLLGGIITLKSKIGEGSVFSFILPIEKHQAIDEIVNKSDIEIEPVEQSNEKGPTVSSNTKSTYQNKISKTNGLKSFLVVENEREQADKILEILEKRGIDVKATDTYENAYGMLSKNTYDGVVLDFDTGKSQAIELLEKLGELENEPNFIITLVNDKTSTEEIAKIQKYTENIIVKGPRLMERLSDETSLFLHYVNERINVGKTFNKGNILKEEALFKGKKVLIVDDDMRNVFALNSILESKGFEIKVGRNGREGIEQFIENPDIQLILLDIMMPEKDGYEVMQEIRSLPKGKDLPIIVLTAKAMKEERKKCIEAGANDYLTKPLDSEKLFSLLRVWLS